MVSVLLKSLLKRQHRSPGDARETGDGANTGFRLTKNLNYTCEYHLLRLQKLLELRYHQHYSINQDVTLRDMIHFASGLQEQDIQRELLLFYLNCPPRVRAYLRSGDMLEVNHYLRQDQKHDEG